MTPTDAGRLMADGKITMTEAIDKVQDEARARGDWLDCLEVWAMIKPKYEHAMMVKGMRKRK